MPMMRRFMFQGNMCAILFPLTGTDKRVAIRKYLRTQRSSIILELWKKKRNITTPTKSQTPHAPGCEIDFPR